MPNEINTGDDGPARILNRAVFHSGEFQWGFVVQPAAAPEAVARLVEALGKEIAAELVRRLGDAPTGASGVVSLSLAVGRPPVKATSVFLVRSGEVRVSGDFHPGGN